MTTEERNILAKQPIIWSGDLDDDCLALWAGLMLRAECMDEDNWWWAVYDMQDDAETVHSSNEYHMLFKDGEIARNKAEDVARNYIGGKL